jgi:hypothetical protein
MDLLTTSELQVITALSLICTLYKSPQYPLSLLPRCCVSSSRSLSADSNSEDSSASRCQVQSSQLPLQNSFQLNYSAISSQPPLQSSTQLSSQSHIATDSQSVSRSVLVSCPIWGIWPETCLFILILRKLQSCLWGRPLWRVVWSVVRQSVLCVMSLSGLYTIYLQNI